MSTVREWDCVVGRVSGLSALHPFAWEEEMPFDIICVVTLPVERRVNQASEPSWEEPWMRTGEERRLRSRLPSPPQPDTTILMRCVVKLKMMNQETTSLSNQ